MTVFRLEGQSVIQSLKSSHGNETGDDQIISLDSLELRMESHPNVLTEENVTDAGAATRILTSKCGLNDTSITATTIASGSMTSFLYFSSEDEMNGNVAEEGFVGKIQNPTPDQSCINRIDQNSSQMSLSDYKELFSGSLGEHSGSLLHAICANRPTLTLVQTLCDEFPFLVNQISQETCQTPLHVACMHGCTPSIVELLIQLYPKAALKQDSIGKVPLHYACSPLRFVNHEKLDNGLGLELRSSANLFDDVQNSKRECHAGSDPAIIDIIQKLFKAAPSSLYVKDICGNSPLDLAKRGKYSDAINTKLVHLDYEDERDLADFRQSLILCTKPKNVSFSIATASEEPRNHDDDEDSVSLSGYIDLNSNEASKKVPDSRDQTSLSWIEWTESCEQEPFGWWESEVPKTTRQQQSKLAVECELRHG